MNELKKIIHKIKNIIKNLKEILQEENITLLKNENYLEILNKIVEKKEVFLKKLKFFHEKRLDIEKKNNFFAPYHSHQELHNCWNEIIQECAFLTKINLENKKILNEKFYINQNFLDILSAHSQDITYDENGNIQY